MEKNYLSIDVGFRNMGWSIFDKDYKLIKVGIIQSSDTKITNLVYSKSENLASKNVIEIKNKYNSKIECYSIIISEMAIILSEIIKSNNIHFATLETPHGGSKSAKAGLMMGMANSMVFSVLTLNKCDFIVLQPKECKQVIKNTLGKDIKVTDKNMSIDTIHKLYNEKFIPKQKYILEHIADSVIAFKTYINNFLKK